MKLELSERSQPTKKDYINYNVEYYETLIYIMNKTPKTKAIWLKVWHAHLSFLTNSKPKINTGFLVTPFSNMLEMEAFSTNT